MAFRGRQENRFWWYNLARNDYVPPVISCLSDEEWILLQDWFDDTNIKYSSPGEIGIPGISFLIGLIGGNGISRIVQCGHYVGFSSIMLGLTLRNMGKRRSLFSLDIDPTVTAYTQDWLDRANLNSVVKLAVMDSSHENAPSAAADWLQGPPQLLFIDSSHQRDHTIRELDRWYPELVPGGLVLMHDVSVFAQQFDGSGKGGVLAAVREWTKSRGLSPLLLNSLVDGSRTPDDLVYQDGCGLGLFQKPL